MDKVIPVVVIKELADTIPTLKALRDGGVNCAEITFRFANFFNHDYGYEFIHILSPICFILFKYIILFFENFVNIVELHEIKIHNSPIIIVELHKKEVDYEIK